MQKAWLGLAMIGMGPQTVWAHGDHPHAHVSDALAHHAGQWDVWLVTLVLGVLAVAVVWRLSTGWARRTQRHAARRRAQGQG